MTCPTLQSLHRWLSPASSPQRLVAEQGEQSSTLADLQQAVRRLVAFLQNHQAERWAIATQDSYHFLVALLALLHSR